MCPSIPQPHSIQPAMGLTIEDMECCVCLQPYSRREKIPRILHCKHTFCGPCLQAMSRRQSVLLTVCCPLCRWITCNHPGLPLAASMLVNTDIWDQIPETQQEEVEAEEQEEERGELEEGEKEGMRAINQTQNSTKCKCSSSRHFALRLKLKSFLRRVRHQ
ncbi:hypothetical protein UPYG_G00091660 [Umbra pygmaea]|uniref:RING-type domain-containing protein n=1 Tax=Umbra pygmaea TaxID=75934 RepID=A0ABD0XFX9_UMBPY